MTVLVTGATGNVGSATVRELLDRGARVRAFVRDPGRARDRLGEGVELASGDFGDPASVRRALDGVARVLLSSADGPDKVADETGVIAAAAAEGVELIVKASTVGARAGSPLPCWDWNGQIEDRLRGAPVAAVNLRSGFYMTNVLMAADQVRGAGRLFAPAGDGAIAMVDPRDVGAVAAAVLTGEGHAGRDYVVTGPEAITYRQVADALAAATGYSVEYVDVPPQAAREGLVGAGMPPWLVDHLDGAFALIRRGELAQATDTVRMLTGREPRTFAAFARDRAGLFAQAGAAEATA
jgi:uncharacterized protein YbjT (DUF2867 family)